MIIQHAEEFKANKWNGFSNLFSWEISFLQGIENSLNNANKALINSLF